LPLQVKGHPIGYIAFNKPRDLGVGSVDKTRRDFGASCVDNRVMVFLIAAFLSADSPTHGSNIAGAVFCGRSLVSVAQHRRQNRATQNFTSFFGSMLSVLKLGPARVLRTGKNDGKSLPRREGGVHYVGVYCLLTRSDQVKLFWRGRPGLPGAGRLLIPALSPHSWDQDRLFPCYTLVNPNLAAIRLQFSAPAPQTANKLSGENPRGSSEADFHCQG
jgi:hypothetical protein